MENGTIVTLAVVMGLLTVVALPAASASAADQTRASTAEAAVVAWPLCWSTPWGDKCCLDLPVCAPPTPAVSMP